jgi:hypothetical protein
MNKIPEISRVPPDKQVNKGVLEVSEFETEISTFLIRVKQIQIKIIQFNKYKI